MKNQKGIITKDDPEAQHIRLYDASGKVLGFVQWANLHTREYEQQLPSGRVVRGFYSRISLTGEC